MPLELTIALAQSSNFEKITLVTSKSKVPWSKEYLNFKSKISNLKNIEILELIVPEKYDYIYEIDPGENRSRWDLESLAFVRLMNEHLNFDKFTHSLSFYILDGIGIPSHVKNILYILGYPKDTNSLRNSIISNYDLIMANSDNVVNQWSKDITFENLSKIKVLVQGIRIDEIDFSKIKKYDHNYFNIVFTGRLIERKGILDLIKSVKLLIERNFNVFLHVFGDGVLKERIIELVKELKLEKNIKLYGFTDNIKDVLVNADLCCFPSQEKEGLMSSVIEGMYYNGLVLTTVDNGSELLIKNNKSGFLIKPNNSDLLAKEIIKITKLDKKSKSNIKSYARQTIIQKCSWQRFTKEFIRFVK